MLAMFPLKVKVGLFHLMVSSRRRSVPRMTLRTRSMASSSGWSRPSNQASTSGLVTTGPFYRTAPVA
jgi:hypothetical protein